MISVCIPARSEGPALFACLESLVKQQDAPPFEVVVGLTTSERAAGDGVRRMFPGAEVGIVLGATPAHARNEIIARANGELLYFVDDDATLAPDTLARLAGLAGAHPDVDVFGGPNLTPKGSPHFERVQGAVLSSFVGTGPVRRRYGRHPSTVADERWFILCNLAVRAAAMRSFDPHLVCAEENALLAALAGEAATMLYDPDLVVYHDRRPDFGSFASQMAKYGRGRGQAIRRHPGTLRVAYVVPSALILYTLALPAGWVTAGWIFTLPLAAYAVVVATGSVKISATLRSLRSGPLAAALVTTMHGCYGLGVMRGLFDPVRVGPAPSWVPTDARQSADSGAAALGPDGER